MTKTDGEKRLEALAGLIPEGYDSIYDIGKSPIKKKVGMRVLVCGGRDYCDQARVNAVLNSLLEQYPDLEIIEGGATGADTLARGWAWVKNVPCLTVPADWKKYGKRAGYIRNAKMLNEGEPDLVIAFPGGPGTGMMVNLADKANVSVRIIE